MDDDDTLASTQNRRPPGNTRLPPLGMYRTMVFVCSYKAVKYKFKIKSNKSLFLTLSSMITLLLLSLITVHVYWWYIGFSKGS